MKDIIVETPKLNDGTPFHLLKCAPVDYIEDSRKQERNIIEWLYTGCSADVAEQVFKMLKVDTNGIDIEDHIKNILDSEN